MQRVDFATLKEQAFDGFFSIPYSASLLTLQSSHLFRSSVINLESKHFELNGG